MATSLVSTGVQFPDSTIQTTAATAGGSVTATASGSLSNGAAAILNTNGTVSAITATTNATGSSSTGSVPSTVGGLSINQTIFSDNNGIVYIPERGVFVALYGTSNGIKILWVGTPTSAGITWQSSALDIGNLSGASGVEVNLVYTGSTSDRIIVTWPYGQQLYYLTARFNSDNSLSLLKSADTFANVPGRTFYKLRSTWSPGTNQLVNVFNDSPNNLKACNICEFNSTTGVVSTATQFIQLNSTSSNNSGMYNDVTVDPATNRVFFAQVINNSFPCFLTTSTLTAGSSTLGAVNNTSFITASTSSNSSIQVTFDSANNAVLMAFFNGSQNRYFLVAATYSGSGIVPTFGTAINTGQSDYVYGYLKIPGISQYVIQQSGRFLRTVSLSGNTITTSSLDFVLSGNGFFADPVSLSYYGLYYPSYSYGSNITSTLTNTNFLGFSDSSYSNGQTATIKTVGSTKNTFSGLTPGKKYYMTGSGSLVTATNTSYAGLALNSSTLLIKG